MKRGLLLFFSLALIIWARVWNHEQIFVDGQVYFVDADCYSRMTRVVEVLEKPGTVLRHHDFENWPVGTMPHATAPLDYLIASLAWVGGNIDLAGAVTPILLALASGFILWKWVAPFRLLTQIAVLLLFAVSPILVHGTVLGRPDHQALLIFLVIAAFATEWKLQTAPTRIASILHGVAWGLALWVSLFEPAILFGASVFLGIAAQGRAWFNRTRGLAAAAMSVVLVSALVIEHWHLGSIPRGALFDRWAQSIGELVRPGWFSPVYLQWFGLVFLALPVALLWQTFRTKNRAAIPWLGLLVLTFTLSAGAVRWGYFLAVAVLFTLPLLLEKWRQTWVAVLFFLGFWPVAVEWDTRLWPSQAESERLAEQREDYRQLREISVEIGKTGGGVIAPWWLSPPVAYWSGAKCVAGSSHQSLPGNEEVANFYLSRFPEKAREIARGRKVDWVIAYEPARVLATASSLVDIPAANDAFGATIYNNARHAPAFLRLEKETSFFRLYRVVDP